MAAIPPTPGAPALPGAPGAPVPAPPAGVPRPVPAPGNGGAAPPGAPPAAPGVGAPVAPAGPPAPAVTLNPDQPSTVLPACVAWRPPPAGPTDAGRWVMGCVMAAQGWQCGPAASFQALPSCQIRNWNPACTQQPWLLPRVGAVTQRVPIYGCVTEEAIPTRYTCPGVDDVIPSGTTDPSQTLIRNQTTIACTVAPPPKPAAPAAPAPSDSGKSAAASVGGTAESAAAALVAPGTMLVHVLLSMLLVLAVLKARVV